MSRIVLLLLPFTSTYGIASVKVCPETLIEKEAATMRLGCKEDQYGNNQYICLPNKEKTELFEICFAGVMGLQEKGTCLLADIVADNAAIIEENCTNLLLGCPKDSFKKTDYYKYPACQAINRRLGCYTLDPNCGEECTDYGNVLLEIMLLFCSILCLMTVPLYFFIKKTYKRCTEGNRTQNEEAHTIQLPEINKEKEAIENVLKETFKRPFSTKYADPSPVSVYTQKKNSHTHLWDTNLGEDNASQV